jgi:hypothetical protein
LGIKLVELFVNRVVERRNMVEPQNQSGEGFPDLCLKTDSFGLMIWASKSPRQFLGLCLKTKWASVC